MVNAANRPVGGFLVRLAAFAATSMALLLLLEVAARAGAASVDERKYAEVFDGQAPIGSIIMGSSTAAYGIDPSRLHVAGQKTYNFAYEGSSPVFTSRWYDLFRQHRPAPSRVIYAVDWFLFDIVAPRRIEHDSEYFPWPDFARLLLSPETWTRTLVLNRSRLSKLRDALQQPPDAAGPAALGERYCRGYAPVASSRFSLASADTWRSRPNVEQVHAFRSLLRRLRADHAALILVEPPEYLPLAGTHDQERQVIASMAAEIGVPFTSYNAEGVSRLNFDRGSFVDWKHLNYAGSQAFSERLATDLRSRGFLRRTTPSDGQT